MTTTLPVPRTSVGRSATRDHRAFAQQHGPLDDVLQLADVARPVVALHRGHRIVGEAGHLAARVFANLFQEAVGQQSGCRSTAMRSGGSSMLITLMR